MKYLKLYSLFESIDNSDIEDIKLDCEDILIDLKDRDINYFVYGAQDDLKRIISIDIGGNPMKRYTYPRTNIEPKHLKLSIEHLISYLKDKGFVFSYGCHSNEDWDYYESCPKCGSEDLFVESTTGGEYSATCNKCDNKSDLSDFQELDYPIKDISSMLKDNHKFQSMSLEFRSQLSK